MTKYEELAHLAVEHSKRFYSAREECSRFAFELIKALADFLEAPEKGMTYVEVNSNLTFGEDQHSVRHGLPNLTYGPDDFWYYGVQMNFALPKAPRHFATMNLLLGVRKHGETFRIRADKDTDISPSDSSAIREFCEWVFANIKQDYENAEIGSPRKRIGFSPTASIGQ